jgi:hypothetical protein
MPRTPDKTTAERARIKLRYRGIRYLEREVFSFERMLKGIYLVLSPAES